MITVQSLQSTVTGVRGVLMAQYNQIFRIQPNTIGPKKALSDPRGLSFTDRGSKCVSVKMEKATTARNPFLNVFNLFRLIVTQQAGTR